MYTDDTIIRIIHSEIIDTLRPILSKYSFNQVLLGINGVQSSLVALSLPVSELEDQKDIANKFGKALESQIMTNYTKNPNYKIER